MMGLVHHFQTFPGDQGIDLGGRQRTVAEQHLQRTQVGAVIEQMGGERVPQYMRTDPARVDAGQNRPAFEAGPALLPGDRMAVFIDEQLADAAFA